MRRVTGLILILALAACSKQEPPPAVPRDEPHRNAPSERVAAPVSPAPAAKVEITAATPPVAPPGGPAPNGEAIFTATCATCHMADGYGVPYLQPSIKGSAWISNPDPQLLLSLILRGSVILGEGAKAYDNDMAPQDHLSDAEIAAVASYVRLRFAAVPIEKPVTPAEVAVARNRPGLP